MISNVEKENWFYFALLHGITSKYKGDFYRLNFSFRTENKLKFYEKICKIKGFCGIVRPSQKDNIFNNINSIKI